MFVVSVLMPEPVICSSKVLLLDNIGLLAVVLRPVLVWVAGGGGVGLLAPVGAMFALL